jgi:hypothetical protein
MEMAGLTNKMLSAISILNGMTMIAMDMATTGVIHHGIPHVTSVGPVNGFRTPISRMDVRQFLVIQRSMRLVV